MTAAIGAIVRISLTLLSGWGLGELMDKLFPGQIPIPTSVVSREGGVFKNLAILTALSIVGAWIVRKVVKKLKLTRTIKI